MRRLTQKQQDQLKLLHDRITLTLDFFDNVEGLGQVGVQLRDGAKTAHARGDVRALRLLATDIDSLAIALPSHEREGLEAMLGSRLGVDKDAERHELRRRVARALKRGIVTSEKERRHLEEYLEVSEAIGGDPAETDAVRRLLNS
jgi:hypothetical protein